MDLSNDFLIAFPDAIDITEDGSVTKAYLVPLLPEEIEERLAETPASPEYLFAEKEKIRESAISKLAKLGLTPEEIAAITT